MIKYYRVLTLLVHILTIAFTEYSIIIGGLYWHMLDVFQRVGAYHGFS